ncbi:MAG TPA: FtsX-like permease family protein, partial [Planctomycetota bacterium]|nr:FtsX-like permease family protein [Planctomycetota bacterium]
QSLNPELRGRTDYILVKCAPGADVEVVRRGLAAALPWNDVFTSAEWAARSKGYWITNTGLGMNMALTVFLGCLVGVVVVAQTLYTSTMEHLKEFGTVKAIGGSNADIYSIIGRQAAIAAVAGFALGVVPPYAIAAALPAIGLRMVIPPDLLALVFVGTVGLCLAAAAVSFRKVAAIDPALVFRG